MVQIKNTTVDKSDLLDAVVGCHACDAWTAAQATLDVDLGFAMATGHLGWKVADLFATSKLDNSDESHNLAEAPNFIRKSYDPNYTKLSSIWSIGEPLKLSHGDTLRPENSSAQAKFIVQHNARPFDAPLAGRMVGSDLIGRALTGINVAPVEGLVGRSEANQIFESLGDFGLQTLQPFSLQNIFQKKDDVSWTLEEIRNPAVDEIRARIPEARAILQKNCDHGTKCNRFSLPEEPFSIDPNDISDVWLWREAAGQRWLI